MSSTEDLTSLSKFLSYVLRHHPEDIGLQLDKNGWAPVSELVKKAKRHGKPLSIHTIEQIIQHGSKQRFILSEDKSHIRAGYGHSVDVDLQLKPKAPPNKLFHGTAQKNVQSILSNGLHAGSRNFVHLSTGPKEAKSVGGRHGSPAILEVKSGEMSQQGYNFYQSESEQDIWLTKRVPPEYIISP